MQGGGTGFHLRSRGIFFAGGPSPRFRTRLSAPAEGRAVSFFRELFSRGHVY
jgi:hypothetical protein